MADTKLSALPAATAQTLDDLLYTVDDPAGTPTSKKVTTQLLLGLINQQCTGRLTLETGVPVSTTDQTGKTDIFFTPFGGNRVALYDGSAWGLYTFSQITLPLGMLTNAKNYDVFLFNNSGTLTLEAVAWTNDTTRETALATQDGIYVKTGSLTKRYVGTFRTTSTTTTEDSAAKRFVFNAQNQVSRAISVLETASTWSPTGVTWASMNASTANRVQMVVGLAGIAYVDVMVAATAQFQAGVAQNPAAALGIGRDSTGGTTSANDAIINQRGYMSAELSGVVELSLSSFLKEYVAVGFHYYQALQWDNASTTIVFVGSDTSENARLAGMLGTVIC